MLAETLRKDSRECFVDVVVPRTITVAQAIACEHRTSGNDRELATHHLTYERGRESQSPRIEAIHFTRRVKDIREAIKAISNRQYGRWRERQQIVDRRHVDTAIQTPLLGRGRPAKVVGAWRYRIGLHKRQRGTPPVEQLMVEFPD